MAQLNNPITIYSIFDKPGDYWNISKIEYETVIENNRKYDSPIEIIIPTYKRPALLFEALNSALNQDVEFEYLITIIDNDPDSLNVELLNKIEYRDKIRYIRNKENLGLFGNWNRAIQVSRAPFVALLHDDDLLESNYLSRLKRVISKYPEVGVVTHVSYQIKNGEIKNPFPTIKSKVRKNTVQSISWEEYLFGNITSASCMLINKEKAIDLNGWSSHEYPSADWFFNARMSYRHKLIVYHFPISKYRWDVNVSLLPDMKKNFFVADISFIVNNLDALSEYISQFNRIRIRIRLYKLFINDTINFKKSINFYYQQRLENIVNELDMKKFSTQLYILFFNGYNRIERIVLWTFNHQRI